MKYALRGANLRPSGSSGSHRRSRLAVLRELAAVLQPSHRDLSIDTLPTLSTSKVLRLHADPSPPGDCDPSLSQPHIKAIEMRMERHGLHAHFQRFGVPFAPSRAGSRKPPGARPEVPWSLRVKGRTERQTAENAHGDHTSPCAVSIA